MGGCAPLPLTRFSETNFAIVILTLTLNVAIMIRDAKKADAYQAVGAMRIGVYCCGLEGFVLELVKSSVQGSSVG